jgi:hypothetical protein
MATNNNKIGARIFSLEYLRLLSTVFGVEAAFAAAFQPLQTTDGIRENETAFVVKTNNTPVTIGTYSKDANVAFGTGTGSTSRFGPRTEVIYTDTDVPYTYELVIHEGIDRVTVNNDFEAAVADRLRLHAIKQTREMNIRNGAFLSASALQISPLADYSDAAVKALFGAMSAYFINNEVIGTVSAYVVPDLFNAIVDHPLAVRDKGSAVNIDTNSIAYFKDFRIVATPTPYFVSGDVAYLAPNEVAIPFVGVAETRAIPSEDFLGLALQSYAKGGQFILDDNKVAVAKVTMAGG